MKKVLFLLILCFAAMQFVRPAKPNASAIDLSPHDFIVQHTPPPQVREVLTTACYDCHSNKTHYPWYTEIQPAGWFLTQHVRDGKRALNFSEFGKLSSKRARKQLENCIDVISEREMPLKSYTLIHRDARLNEEQIKSFVAWAEEEIRRSEQRLAGD